MTYERINFVDQSVERPRTYEMTHNADGSITLTDSFGLVDELGTPINADTMNHIEDGIYATAIRKYNKNETFALNEWVLGTVANETNFYKSLKDNNLNNPLTDTNYWEVVKIGSGGSLPIGAIIPVTASANYVPENLLYCDGAERTKEEFPDLWNDFLTGEQVTTTTLAPAITKPSSNYVCNIPVRESGGLYGNFVIDFTTPESLGAQIILCYRNGTGTFQLSENFELLDEGNVVCQLEPNKNYQLIYSPTSDEESNVHYVDLYGDGNVIYGTDSIVDMTNFVIFSGFANMIDLENSYYYNAEGEQVPFATSSTTMQTLLDVCTYDEYETELTMTGSCWKWAVDTENETFRPPFVPDKVSERFLVKKKEPTEADPTWYNLYSDGWCEQGGRAYSTVNGWNTITLLKEYINNTYSITTARAKVYSSSTTSSHAYVSDNSAIINLDTISTNSFQYYSQNDSDGYFTSWETSGYTNFAVEKTIKHFVVVSNGSINESQRDWSQYESSLQGKANTDLSNLNTQGKKVIDGQWIYDPIELSTATTAEQTIDLSDYLPDDDYNYEVLINTRVYSGENERTTYIGSDLFINTNTFVTHFTNTHTRTSCNMFVLPVGQERYITITATNTLSLLQCGAFGYRRIGTNE